MTETCALPDFSLDEAACNLRDLYGIEGRLQSLNGERDLNYLVTTDSGLFVFKIANHDESYGMLECQHLALEHLASHQVMPQSTSSVESLNGAVIETISNETGVKYFCRLLPYIDGCLLSGVKPHSRELLFDLGKTLALIDQALQNFKHEALNRPLLWNMCDVLKTLERFKSLLASEPKRKLVEHFESRFRETVLPLENKLRMGVIHNDANDNNVLVEEDNPRRLTSIIDFGDMVYSWLAVEPSVAATYAMLGKEQPLDVAATIIEGYHSRLALRDAEIRAIFELICMRLCMSVCICAYQRSIDPGNEYLSISEQPAWDLLQKLRRIQSTTAQNQFRTACGLAQVGAN